MPQSIDKLLSQNTNNKTSTNSIDALLKQNVPNGNNVGLQRAGQVSPTDLMSQYDTEIGSGHTVEDIQENRAQKQTRLDRVANAIPRLASKVTTEVLKTPAYLYAIGEAVSTDKTLAQSLDNAWLNTLQNLDDKTKETFAVYTPKSVKEGNLWDNITSTSFWTNEGVDGAGFLISMMAPAAALKTAGIAGKMAKIGASASIANNVELGAMTLMNTTLESAAETKGLVDNLKPELQRKVESGEINQKTGKPWTPEDIDQTLGEVGQSAFLSNMALLAGPNFIMNKNLLGRFVPTKNTLNSIVDDAGKFIELTPISKKQLTGNYAKQVGKGLFSEGFVEEAGQFAIEDYHTKLAKGNTRDGLVSGLLDSYADALTTTEGQKSILLGGVFGAVGGIKGSKQVREEEKYKSDLSKMMKENFDGFSTSIDNIYEKKDGKVVLDKNNEPVLNYKKTAQALYNIALESKDSEIKDIYALAGNKEAFDYITNNEFTRFALPYLQQEGGLDVLNKHIDQLSKKMVDQKKQLEGIDDSLDEQKYTFDLKQKAVKLQKVHDSIDNVINTINLKVDDQNRESLGNFLGRLKSSAIQETSKQFFLSERIDQLSMDVAGLSIGTASNLPQVKNDIKKTQDQIDKYKKALDESIEKYSKIFDKKEVEKAFNDYLNSEEKQEEVIEELKGKEEKVNKDFAKQQEQRVSGEAQPEVNEQPVTFETKPLEVDIPKELDKLDKQEDAEIEALYRADIDDIDEAVQRVLDKYKKRREDLSNKSKETTSSEDKKDLKDKEDKLNSEEKDDFIESKEFNESIPYEKTPIDALFDLQGKQAKSWNKTAGGEDNDKKLPEQRYFRFLEKNNLSEGTGLQLVTRKSNKKLFDQIFDKGAEDYEKSTGIDTIYAVFVDKDNNPIYSKQDGEVITDGSGAADNLVYATMLTEIGVNDTVSGDKEVAIKELNKFRKQVLLQTFPVRVNVIKKSNGILVREKTESGKRRFNPALGYITSDIKKDGLLELPTIVVGDNNATRLAKNGQKAQARKLYAYDDNGVGVDLMARNLTDSESAVLINLIKQRLGNLPRQKEVEDIGKEIDKLVYFGVPESGAKEYTLGIKDNQLYVGKDKVFTKEDMLLPENQEYVSNFLIYKKYVNASSKIPFNSSFREPLLNDEGSIEFKEWGSYQEYLLSNEGNRLPLFGTDIPALGKSKFRNYYVTYDPTIINESIKLKESDIKPDLTPEYSTEIKVEDNKKDDTKSLDNKEKPSTFVDSKTGKKDFKKSGKSKIINLSNDDEVDEYKKTCD